MCNRYRARNGLDEDSINSLSGKNVTDTFLPIMEALFKLPGRGPAEGSTAWIRQQTQNIDRVSFYVMSKHRALLKAYVKREIRSPSTNDQGFVTLEKGEEVPNGRYKRVDPSERLSTHTYSRSNKTVPRLPFLRRVSHTKAINALKEAHLFPLNMNPESTPDKAPWNNYAHVIYYYHVFYCVSEGLHRTSVTARKVLLYLSHGFATPESTLRGVKCAPVIRIIHHACNNGRHLTSQKTLKKHFSKLLKLLDGNPDMKKLLLDKGKTKAPKVFLAYMEDGLRNIAEKTGCMGRVSMSSPSAWAETPSYKKREVYKNLVK